MTKNIIDYITQNTSLKQKDIAKKLGVTTGQISKWKQGEYISAERRLELNQLADLFSDNPDWVDISKTKPNAESWFKYITQLSDNANLDIKELIDNKEILIPPIFIRLSQLGVKIPKKAISINDSEWRSFGNSLSNLLLCYSIIFKWNSRHFLEISNEKSVLKTINEITDETLNIALSGLIKIHRSSLGINENLFLEHIQDTKSRTKKLIQKLLRKMNLHKILITEDFFLVIDESPDWLAVKLSLDDKEDNIHNYLPYSERKKLELTQYETLLLESLHQKVNNLLKSQDLKIHSKEKSI